MTRKKNKSSARRLPKVPTNIAGLDDLLHGGVPEGRVTLVSGGPGSGKSVLGMEFLYRGAAAGEPGVYVTFEEQAASLRQNALTLGWDLEALEKSGKLFVMDARLDPGLFLSGEFNLSGLLAILEGKAKSIGTRRMVVDAIDVLLRLLGDPKREQAELYALHEWLLSRDLTGLLTVKASIDERAARYEFLDFMVDCVLHLDSRVVNQVSTRRARVIKYRGSSFGANEYPFIITGRGLRFIPLTSVNLEHPAMGPHVTSGHPRLDAMLGGGIRRTATVLISGETGTGKTTLAATFIRAACERGERALVINLEESSDCLLDSLLSPGIDLRPHIKSGILRIEALMPEATGVEEHLVRVLDLLEQYKPDYLVLDSISSCERMGSPQAAREFIVRLADASKTAGITSLYTNQVSGAAPEQEISGMGVSSLMDTVIKLQYAQSGGEVNRLILAMKSRGSAHSNQYREFKIGDDGIDIVDVFIGEGGVLTGVARFDEENRQKSERLLRQQEIERKEIELAQLKTARDLLQTDTIERASKRHEDSDSRHRRQAKPGKKKPK